MKQKKNLIIFIIISLLIIGIFVVIRYQKKLLGMYEELKQSHFQQEITEMHTWEEETTEENINSNTGSGVILLTKIPEKYNLKMEFHSQAPLLEWDEIHEEMCEEASILLVINYFKNISMTDKMFDQELLKMKKGEEDILKVWESTTVHEMKEFIEEYFEGFRVEIIEDITVEQIEQYVASNIPVLLPVSGQTIGNPFYTPPGPVYHILVVKGYTKTHFITNDVGTKRGQNFFYEKNVIMNNIHDWDEKNIFNGKQRGFVIFPK